MRPKYHHVVVVAFQDSEPIVGVVSKAEAPKGYKCSDIVQFDPTDPELFTIDGFNHDQIIADLGPYDETKLWPIVPDEYKEYRICDVCDKVVKPNEGFTLARVGGKNGYTPVLCKRCNILG